ncbi:MAG: hypothetical protein AAF581_19585 [Planctomycetota bacterium]
MVASNRRLPLSGADVCLLALDRHMVRGPGLRGTSRVRTGRNIVQLVVECQGTLPQERIDAAIARFVEYAPWPLARLRRAFPWSAPFWEAPATPQAAPRVTMHEIGSGDAPLQEVLEQRLNTPLDPHAGTPVRFDVIDQGKTSHFVQTWFHPLMDPRGAETLTLHLNHLDENAQVADPWPDGVPSFVPPPQAGTRLERLRLASKGRRYLDSFRATPPTSPGGHATRSQAQSFRFKRCSFRDSGTASRAQKEMTWRLALVGRILRRVWQRHGIPEVPYLLPVSVDLRKKGEAGPVFSNHLSLHFPQFDPNAEIDAINNELRKQMFESLRHGQLEATRAAMNFIRPLPLPLLAWRMALSSRGELCSFNFADTGEYSGATETLFGCPIVNSYHLPTVTPKPGIGIFLNSCGQNQNIVVTWLDGIVGADEIDDLIAEIGKGLGWVPQPVGEHVQ